MFLFHCAFLKVFWFRITLSNRVSIQVLSIGQIRSFKLLFGHIVWISSRFRDGMTGWLELFFPIISLNLLLKLLSLMVYETYTKDITLLCVSDWLSGLLIFLIANYTCLLESRSSVFLESSFLASFGCCIIQCFFWWLKWFEWIV